MKRVLAALALIAVLAPTVATPAFAEESEAMKAEREQKRKVNEETDRAYRAAIKNTMPDKAVRVDPWSNARDTAPATTASGATGKPKQN